MFFMSVVFSTIVIEKKNHKITVHNGTRGKVKHICSIKLIKG